MAKSPRRTPATPAASPAGGPGAPPLEAKVAALRALAHPTRLRLLELFAERPRTTKQAAELLGVPPTRLYHHVNALERAGLLELRETRANRGAVEKWYAMAAELRSASREQWSAADDAAPPPVALARTILAQSQHELVAALATKVPVAPLLMRLITVGPRSRQAAIRRKIEALVASLPTGDAEADQGDDDERWALTITLAPVVAPAPRAGRGTADRPSRAR
jgi:DNA-binding transcriptional ArsR family regulator